MQNYRNSDSQQKNCKILKIIFSIDFLLLFSLIQIALAGGDLLINIVSLRFKNDINKYTIIYGSNVITGSTSDKFTLDTPMYSNGI